MSQLAGAPTSVSTPEGRRRLSRRVRFYLVPVVWLLVTVGLVVLVLLAQFLSSRPTGTVWQSITSGISGGVVPKQTALEAFAYLYKVDIPGVSVPGGREGGDQPTSGSGALAWVQAHWKELTPDQQAVINRYLVAGPSDQTIPINPSPAAVSRPGFQLTAAHNVGTIKVHLALDAPTSLATAIANELAAEIAHIGPKLGMPVLSPGSLLNPNITLTLSPTDGGYILLTTDAMDDGHGNYTPCNVTVWKNEWSSETVASDGGVSPALHVLIAHEVVHCYQNVVWGDIDTAHAIPPWITEGTALWLAADDTGIQEVMIPGMWQYAYFSPETPLTNRSYDAFGYYALLAHQGRSLWSLMLPAWQAAAKSSERSNAFIAVLQGDAPDIRDNWAESYLRHMDWGDPWIAYGFGLPAAAEVYQHPAQAQSSPGWIGSLLSRSNTVLNVESSVGEVVTVSTDGLASVHDQGGNSATAFQSERFCTVTDGCVCPPGTLEAGADMASARLDIPFVAAFNAPSGGSHYSILGEKLDDLCKQPPTPQPIGGGPCGSDCSNSNGDPHLLTVNGFHYDFQAAGEFTLLRSADRSLEIQARQEPFGTVGGVATNTAIAARVGAHRVAIYASGGNLQARVDGVSVDLSSPLDLGAGGRIAAYADGFQIDFPDGTTMWALSVGQWGINAQVRPSSSLKTAGVGLLGPIVRGGLGLPALPDGTQLPVAPDRHARHNVVYGQFADAWRVTDATSLFDYDQGKSTITYTIRGYPADTADFLISDLTPAQVGAGDSACAAITDSGLHDDCVYDVAVTGQSGFAQSYQATQTFFDSGIALPTPGPATSGTPVQTSSPSPTPASSGSVTGAMQVVQGTNLGGFALGPDDLVYISALVSPGHATLVQVDPRTSSIVHQIDLPAATEVHVAGGSVWLPGLKTDATGKNCSVTRLDRSSLAEQATIPIPCTHTGPQIVSDGSAIWFVDTTKYDLATAKGAVLTRIDPTTNTFGPSVDLPFTDGQWIDAQGALFYFDTTIADTGYYRLATGASALEALGKFNSQAFAGGAGLWVASDDGHSARYFTASGTPQVTLPIPGSLVGGDSIAAYFQVQVTDAAGQTSEQLWRYPVDGSRPTQLASSPNVNGVTFSYARVSGLVGNGDGVLATWFSLPAGSSTPAFFIQWAPLK